MIALVAIPLFVGCKREPGVQRSGVGTIGPAGGYIFYDCDADNTNVDAGDNNLHSSICGWRFLEVAPTDLKDNYYVFGFDREGCSDAIVGTSAKIGRGEGDSEKLVKALGERIGFFLRLWKYKINICSWSM